MDLENIAADTGAAAAADTGRRLMPRRVFDARFPKVILALL